MPTPTHKLIQSVTVSQETSSVTFDSITSSYKDLVLVMSLTGDSTAGGYLQVQINSSSIGYSSFYFSSDGTTAGLDSSWYNAGDSGSRINFAQFEIDNEKNYLIVMNFFDYSASTGKTKTVLSRFNAAGTGVNGTEIRVHRWNNVNAITSLRVELSGNNIGAGSVLSLYGVHG